MHETDEYLNTDIIKLSKKLGYKNSLNLKSLKEWIYNNYNIKIDPLKIQYNDMVRFNLKINENNYNVFFKTESNAIEHGILIALIQIENTQLYKKFNKS
jgi:hypothetical protein